MESSAKSIEEVVEEIMRTHRSLPARPGIDEVEVAKTLILNVDKEEQARIEAIARKRKGFYLDGIAGSIRSGDALAMQILDSSLKIPSTFGEFGSFSAMGFVHTLLS
ncbi:hypothetical protein CsSME_00033913 [Camellia sinensis var. sinensis]